MQTRRLILIALLGLSSFMLTDDARAQGSVEIRGWVMGVPISKRVVLRLEGPSKRQATSKPGGRWSIQVSPGTYTVIPQAAGMRFTPAQRRVQAKRGVIDAINFSVIKEAKQTTGSSSKKKASLSISGWVRGIAGGDTVQVKAEGPTPASTSTKAGGVFELSNLRPGRYRLRFESDTYQISPQPKMVRLAKKNRKGLRFKAKPRSHVATQLTKKPKGFTVRGRIRAMHVKQGCQQAYVQAVDGFKIFATLSKGNSASCGEFEFELPPGNYTFSTLLQNSRYIKSILPKSQTIQIDHDLKGVSFKAIPW